MLYDSVHPKLRLDARFFPTSDGVLFSSRGRAFSIKGKGVYDLVSRLAPHLNGDLTIADICSDLDRASQSGVRRLLETLVEKQVVIDRLTEDTPLLQSVRSTFRAQIDFIEHFADRPHARFSKLREANVFVTGAGVALSSMCVALARNGVGTITLDQDVTSHKDQPLLASELAKLQAAGVTVRVAHSSLLSALSGSTARPTALCFASSEPDFKQLLRLNKYSLDNKIHFIPGYVLDGCAIVGPHVTGQSGCLTCSLLRRVKHMSPDLEADLWRGIALSWASSGDAQPSSYPAPRILGNLVAFELFKALLDQVSDDLARSMTSIDLETLETTTVRLLPAPSCRDCRSFASDGRPSIFQDPSLQDSTPSLSTEEQLAAIQPAVNKSYGLFHAFEDDTLIQTPLFRSAIITRKEDRPDACTVRASSLVSNASARVAAFLEAAARSTFDTSEDDYSAIQTAFAGQPVRFPSVDARLLSHFISFAENTLKEPLHAMSARSLRHAAALGVPFLAVFPNATRNAGLFEASPAGIGAAFSYEDASRVALSSLIAFEALKRVFLGKLATGNIELDALAAVSPDVAYLLSVCRHLRIPLHLSSCSVTGYGFVVVAASQADADPSQCVIGSHSDLIGAATQALTELLALSLDGTSRHTLRALFPLALGYNLQVPLTAPREEGTPAATLDPHHGNSPWFDDVVIADCTTPDLAQLGISICRALMISTPLTSIPDREQFRLPRHRDTRIR